MGRLQPGGPLSGSPTEGWAWHLPVAAVAVAGVLAALAADQTTGLRLAGVAGSVVAYAVLVRWSVWTWLAGLATVPAALGAGLLDLPTGRPAAASVVALLVTSAGLLAAGWRGRPPDPTTLLAVGPAAAGAVLAVALWWSIGGDRPAAADWSSPGAFFVLALPAAVGLFAVAGVARASGSPALRVTLAVLVLAPLVVLLATRGDALGALAWWPAAGVLGLTAVLRGRRGAAAARPQVDATDRQALEDFDRTHPGPLAPVVIVIAAYNEAEGLPGVLEGLPRELCGLPVDVVVVDDGSSDGTAEAASAAAVRAGHGHVVACTTNRGQGAALRLGYRIARTHGVSYVLTTDADGQYDVADMPRVLGPVVEGRADFVTGSRRLGALHNRDRVRQLGTHVFAWLASALVGQYFTDTSFGLRAMRAEVTGAVTLNQPQYQSSELMVGVASHGFRVLEVPGTMNRRAAGSSKKGRNLVYGSRYGRVMLGTWWREGAPRPVTETAPALLGSADSVREGAEGGRPG